MSEQARPVGGIVHTYQKYNPQRFPSPTAPPPDLVSGAFEHLLAFGDMRELTPEQLARAVKIDPSQIAGLGPSIDALIAMLMERKRKILATYETRTVRQTADREFRDDARGVAVPKKFRARFEQAVREEQIYDLERLWYSIRSDGSKFARQVVQLMERLGEKYEIDELAAKYEFTGRESLTIPQALAVKEELEKIDELLKQLEEARENARLASSTWRRCPSLPSRATWRVSPRCSNRSRTTSAKWPSGRGWKRAAGPIA